MLRPRRPLPVLTHADNLAARFYATTRGLFQLQARDRPAYGAHGAGIVRHEPATAAPPAADLFRTKVHEGTGTGAGDPYVRTLPNTTSRGPESSVSRTHAATAATVDECGALHRVWGDMRYWLAEHHPRLVIYLRQLRVPDVPPLSPAAESLLSKFETVAVAKLVSSDADGQRLRSLWRETVAQTNALRLQHIFDRATFELKLSNICKEALQHMQAISLNGMEGSLAIEALRRQTLLGRNEYIQKHLVDVIENQAYLGFGDAVWQVFFQAVEANKAELFGKNTSDAIRFAWEAIMQEDVVRLPDVTVPVALYLILVCIRESGKLVVGALKENSSNLDEGLRPHFTKHKVPPLALLNSTVKRRFVAKTVGSMLQSVSSNVFSRLLREYGMHDLSREVSFCEAMNSNQKVFEEDIVEALSRFENKNEVKTLLFSLIGGTDVAVRDTVTKILGMSALTSVDWEALMQSIDWTNNWRRLATELLCDQSVLIAIHKVIKNAIGAKGMSRHLFSEEYAEQLQKIITLREEREASKKLRIDRVVLELSSYEKVDQSCDLLRQMGVDMTELDHVASSVREKNLVKRPHVDDGVLASVLEAVANRHPNWTRAGVMASNVEDSMGALRTMLHIFIRLAYVPHTGAAAIAQRSRRRIGPVGLQSGQFNVPTEVGFVEHYDNLQYKRYDWQGWYQRMVDVHNRNVSLRCRINDLKRLDANGMPFVDMQTERRLRILAQERVGMGVLMLDADKYEDQSDNMTFGAVKLSELLSDARKAQLGEEYWPSVELKVRKPSGQSKAHYSLIDYDRIERRSKELYEKYRDAKKRSLFVTPMDMWLEVKGMQVRKAADNADADGYTVDSLQDVLGSENVEGR